MMFVKAQINNALRKLGYQVVRVDHKPSIKHVEYAPEDLEAKRKLRLEMELKKTLQQQTRDFRRRFKLYAKSHKTIRLHFGCGPRVLKDWVNIDLAFEPFGAYMKYYTDKYYPEGIRGDKNDFYAFDPTKKPLPIPDNSVDIVFHEDFIEHINQRDQVAFLAETLRVLKEGGIHRVNTPNLVRSMRDQSVFPEGFKGVYFGEWDKHQHLSVMTESTLKELALLVGYSKVIFNRKNGSTSTLVPLEYRPDPKDRPADGNIYADLIK